MRMKNLIFTTLLAMVVSTTAYAVVSDACQFSKTCKQAVYGGKSFAQFKCERDPSCKWVGNDCTYKSNSHMKFHCEKTLMAIFH